MGQMQRLSKNNTAVFTENGATKIVLHRTQVVAFDSREITLNSGGWRTVTTKARMNQASHQFGLGYYVYQTDFDWFVRLPNGMDVPFEDNMRFSRN